MKNMRNDIVTIVIPVYNVECFLNRCLESVVNQTYKDLEIILVDDCSPDNSPKLCEEWAQRDQRIKVIHKPVNQGLGMARNTGLENATGEYIFFFDSDDYVSSDVVEKCVREARSKGAQIVCFGINYVNQEGIITGSRIPTLEKTCYRENLVIDEFLPDLIAPDPQNGNISGLTMSAWAAMYDVRVLKKNNWMFVSERQIISEDVYSLLGLYRFVDCVAVVAEGMYFYCNNGSSLTHSYREDRYLRIRDFYQETLKLCKACGYSEQIQQRLSLPYFVFVIAALKQEVSRSCGFREQMRALQKIISDEVLQEALRKNRWGKVSITRRMMLATMRHKLYVLSWFLLKGKA